MAKKKDRMIGDDFEFQLAQCIECKHYAGGLSCNAFARIPDEIYNNKHDHRKPYSGDNGIQFEALDDRQT